MKNLIAAVLVFVSFNAFGQKELDSLFIQEKLNSPFVQKELDLRDFIGAWTYPEGYNIFVFYPVDDVLKIKLITKKTGYIADMSILGVEKDSLITELYTPKNNWYIRKVFYIKKGTLIAKTTGNSNRTEYFKKI